MTGLGRECKRKKSSLDKQWTLCGLRLVFPLAPVSQSSCIYRELNDRATSAGRLELAMFLKAHFLRSVSRRVEAVAPRPLHFSTLLDSCFSWVRGGLNCSPVGHVKNGNRDFHFPLPVPRKLGQFDAVSLVNELKNGAD